MKTTSPDLAIPRGHSALRSYVELTRFTFLRNKGELPFYLILQMLVSGSVIFGLAIMADTSQAEWTRHLAAGSWALSLMMIGCLVVPTKMASSLLDGFQEFQRTLPIPRPVLLLADATVWSLACLPGFLVSIGLAVLHLGVRPTVDGRTLILVLAALLAYLMIGYSVALWIPPAMAGLVQQVIILGAMLFSPITYPADRIPDWAVVVHSILPFTPAANLVREGFFPTGAGPAWTDLVSVVAWGALFFVLALKGVARRG
ncbi:ABC transporter permease [Falsarthrobacter nasiphocae]|uniref:ABC-2 type transport system permease protein n=1 Tax=Falsarthrobacter nasiphocae TaxID=189863 RepID=A0AAE3YGG7_9MICC|nr:ABC transporter permease [Falsarthrobacter nasiphocae]MDR6892755.1 ABC-2 type transport system permease protein [Falsarthrobacter nasiphocae]